MNRAWVAIIFLSAILILTGCEEQDFELASSNKPLISKLDKGEPIPLEQIESSNVVALQFATSTVDFLEDDKFLAYINQAKDRDKAKQEQAELLDLDDALEAAFSGLVEGLEEALTDGFGELFSGFEDLEVVDEEAEVGEDRSADDTETDDGEAEEDAASRYTSDDNGFSLIFFDSWTVTEGTKGDKDTVKAESESEGSDDKFLENTLVVVEELVAPVDLDEYTDVAIKALGIELIDFAEVEREAVEIDKTPAKRIVYTYTSGGVELKSVVYVIVSDFTGYTITGTAEKAKFSSYESKFDKAGESFQFE